MDSEPEDQYVVIIVECCQNCDTHQAVTRHSEWKYYEQFNEFKRKIERFVPNTIVVKNPIPDELHKPADSSLSKNQYVSRDTDEVVLFPRIAAFEVYIYNVLVYSKLISNSWPNHYKLIQVLSKIIEEHKKGNSLDEYSVYRGDMMLEPVEPKAKVVGSKKKKKDYRVYKSKDKPMVVGVESPTKKLQSIDSVIKKNHRRLLLEKGSATIQLRPTETRTQNRVKLPSLQNVINFREEEEGDSSLRKSNKKDKSLDKSKDKSFNKIFNSMDEFDKNQISLIQRKQSIAEDQQFNSLVLDGNQSMDLIKPERQDSMKFLQNRSVQYSEKQFCKDYMNRSVQYSQEEGQTRDFGLQFDDGSIPKEINVHFVQTDKIEIIEESKSGPKKPYMLDEQVQANIIIPKDQATAQTQTLVRQYESNETNTDPKPTVNRGYQFPEEEPMKVDKTDFNTIDESFTHLFEKRRNILEQKFFYSVDKFEEKATRYKWIGRAGRCEDSKTVPKENVPELRKAFTLEMLVFCFYNYFGIKTPQKRLSLQSCSNVITNSDESTNRINSKKTDASLVHVMTVQNPELQYPQNFQECDYQESKYPLTEELTFRSSKQTVKFTNYGGLLALAYFLGDKQVFEVKRSNIGLAISNDEVKEIYKLSADRYVMPNGQKNSKNLVEIGSDERSVLALDRMSEQVQRDFVSMISKIVSQSQFTELLRAIRDNFVDMLPSHKDFKQAIVSTKLQKIDQNLVEQFIEMLKSQREALSKMYKGEIYTLHRYRCLQPKITFSLENSVKKDSSSFTSSPENPAHIQLERRITYQSKDVSAGEVEKHIRNKDTLVILEGESGIGKSTFLQGMVEKLKAGFENKLKVRVIGKEVLTDETLMAKRVNEIIDEHRKQILIVDGAEAYFTEIMDMMKLIYDAEDRRIRPEISYFLALSCEGEPSSAAVYQNRVKQWGLQVVGCQLLPISVEDIRGYMMKCVQFHNYTDKKNFLNEILGDDTLAFSQTHPHYKVIKVLQNPFYLNLYTQYLGHVADLNDPKACLQFNFNRYSMLKEAHNLCYRRHLRETSEMQEPFYEECSHLLNKIAFEYFHNKGEVSQNIRELANRVAKDQMIISNQLCFYPVNLEALIKRDKPLFVHRQYFNYFLIEAYAFYLEKSYRNLKMNCLYQRQDLVKLITEHYLVERTQGKLTEIVEKSRKYKNTQEQASCAMTLLIKMGYVFSNYNFDEVDIPEADLSFGVFYMCTFRSANMNNAQMYRTQMVGCQVDGARMDSINMLVRKYEIEYTVVTAAMSNDGAHLALGCGNYLIILQTETGKELKKIDAHMDIIRTVKYAKDGTSLVTIADDKTLRMWDTRTYRSVVFRLPQKGTIAFSNETESIASVSKNNLKVWNIKSMANQFTLEGHSDLITTIHFSLDGKDIATGSRDTTVKLWSLVKGELTKTLRGHSGELLAVRISPSKRLVVSSSKEKDLIVWGFEKGNEINRTKLPDQIIEICLNGQEKYLAIALAKEQSILVLDLETLRSVHILEGHKARILSLNFDTTYQKLISLGKDKTVRVWEFSKIMKYETDTLQEMSTNQINRSVKPILAIAYCRLTNKYATSHSNGEINFYTSSDNRKVDQVISHNGAVQCLQFDKSGKLYSGGSDGVVRVWNLPVKREPKTLELHSSQIIQMRLNEKHRLIATSSTANEMVIADFTGIKIIMSTREEGRVQAIEFSKDDKMMALGGTEKYIAMYEIMDGGNVVNRKEELGPSPDTINCLKFQGDKYLVAALKNGQVAIWNHIKGTLVKKIENVSPIISVLSFQKKFVCFSSEDGKIRVVDMNEGRQVKTFRYSEPPTSLTTNGDENLLYATTERGNIMVWNLNSLKPKRDKVEFDRLSFDEEGNEIVQVEGPRQLLIRNLNFHEEAYIKVKDLPSSIEGASYYRNCIVLLLKNGMHWDLKKSREYTFGEEQESQGDLHWIKQKFETNFFKTPVKKIKGIKKPIQGVLEELSL